MNPFRVDDFLPGDLYVRLAAEALALPMVYGSKSNGRTDPHGHWSAKPVHDRRMNLADVAPYLPAGPLTSAWAQLGYRFSELWGEQPILVRCYYNGYTYGTDGYFHCDSERAGEVTAILYLVPEWHQDWAGETVVQVGPHDYVSFLPAPNRLVLLPSNSMHCARAVSRKCTELRKVLVFKVRPRRSVQFERLSAFLARSRALSINHAEGSLHDHLMRCYQLCEDRNLPDHVRLAAGLHSIYGTNVFQQKLFDASERNRADIALLWGAAAENLAYKFSLLDRPKTLDSPRSVTAIKAVLRTSYNVDMDVSLDDLADLRLVECANLADQKSLDRWSLLSMLWNPKGG